MHFINKKITVSEISKMPKETIKDELYATGLTLNFFESPDFEMEDRENSEENAAKIARNALRILMMGWRHNWKDLLSLRVLWAVFIKRDHELVKGMRLAFQQGFDHLFDQLRDRELTDEQFRQAQFYISNCLTLLPFADLTPYESFAIPQYVDNQWKKVDYKVTPIELTPTKGFRKLFISDADRVFAYGLEPIVDQDATSHLIFMGTTYPAGQGFYYQVPAADSEAFETPGKSLLRYSHRKIGGWADKQNDVHVCGTSLGGSLSLLAAALMGEKFSRVDALNPTGLYKPWRPTRYDRWHEIENKPQVFVQKQGNDPVSKFARWKPEWEIVHVEPPDAVQGPNGCTDHALNYAGFEGTRFVGVDPEEDNEERKSRDFWIFTMARSILFYTVMVPFRHVVLPLVRYVLNHKLLLLFTALAVASSFLVPLVVPSVSLTTLLVCAFVPLAINLAYKLGQALMTILGLNEVKFAKLHDPALPRNETMDIYKNEVEADFTYREINDYFTAKELIPIKQEEIEEAEEVEGEEKLTKQMILERANNPQYADEEITFRGSKAKVYDIRKTVDIMNRYRLFEQTPELEALKTEELQEQHDVYTLGLGKQRGIAVR